MISILKHPRFSPPSLIKVGSSFWRIAGQLTGRIAASSFFYSELENLGGFFGGGRPTDFKGLTRIQTKSNDNNEIHQIIRLTASCHKSCAGNGRVTMKGLTSNLDSCHNSNEFGQATATKGVTSTATETKGLTSSHKSNSYKGRVATKGLTSMLVGGWRGQFAINPFIATLAIENKRLKAIFQTAPKPGVSADFARVKGGLFRGAVLVRRKEKMRQPTTTASHNTRITKSYTNRLTSLRSNRDVEPAGRHKSFVFGA